MFFSKLKETFSNKIAQIFNSSAELEEKIDELEETLILADVGFKTATDICSNVRKALKKLSNPTDEEVKEVIKQEMISIFDKANTKEIDEPDKKVILVVGVNGVGKTTSIAKLSNIYKKQLNKKVLLVAGDTFRAAAREQLELWAEVAEVGCVSGADGADPASVIFDGTKKFKEGNYDVLICDTAGRLHNKKSLMEEIEKIKRTIDKNIPDIEKEVLMVIDATTGQNAVEQAKAFYDRTSIDGIILTKLDSTAKGGVVFSIINELNIPIRYVGIGEKIEDIKRFDAREFVEAII